MIRFGRNTEESRTRKQEVIVWPAPFLPAFVVVVGVLFRFAV